MKNNFSSSFIPALLLSFLLFLPLYVQSQGTYDQPHGDYDWASFRNLNQSSYQAKFQQNKNRGYRLIDTEPYYINNRQGYIICFPQKEIVVVILCNTWVGDLSDHAKELARNLF